MGLYRLELSENKWIFRLSETAKRYLINDEPNVSAFMLLQLTLFQYPNGMGVAYSSNSNKLRIQANTRTRTFNFIQNNIHLSPLRLICKGLQADATLRKVTPLQAYITSDELFVLANHPKINQLALPESENVVDVLQQAREGKLLPPRHYENRLHILNHTDFISVKNSKLFLREVANNQDREDIIRKFHTIVNLEIHFTGFDNINDEAQFEAIIRLGLWGNYFDALQTLNGETIEILANDSLFDFTKTEQSEIKPFQNVLLNVPLIYPFKKRNELLTISGLLPTKRIQFADPEITRIKRQRSNLTHKLILQQLDEYLRNLGAEPLENEHIDLFAQMPSDNSFIFEVKSATTDNLLSQTRKGLSQLYEYRFRYKEEIGYGVTLCLVYPYEPNEFSWLQEYLCLDRQIAVCWFSESGELNYSKHCETLIKPLLIA